MVESPIVAMEETDPFALKFMALKRWIQARELVPVDELKLCSSAPAMLRCMHQHGFDFSPDQLLSLQVITNRPPAPALC